MENTNQISINMKVYELLNDAAEKRKVTPDKLANQLLESEINRKFNPFFDGRKWAIPKNVFIITALPREGWKKLRKWLDKGNHVSVNTMSKGEILILNETRLDKHNVRNTKITDS